MESIKRIFLRYLAKNLAFKIIILNHFVTFFQMLYKIIFAIALTKIYL